VDISHQRSLIEHQARNAITLPGGSIRGVVYCPPGMRAFGGGGYNVKPFGGISIDAREMTSNTVSADGTGWTFRARTLNAIDRVVIRTRCAPLRGSRVAQASVTFTNLAQYQLNVFAACPAGYTALSGGVYLANPDGTEADGWIDHSIQVSGNRWYVNGGSGQVLGKRLVALEQCIL
jgi:hypothetical protein